MNTGYIVNMHLFSKNIPLLHISRQKLRPKLVFVLSEEIHQIVKSITPW